MTSNPFFLPPKLEPDLSLLLGYWNDRRRGNAEMPFADDIDPTALPNPRAMMLIEVSGPPVRFRLAMVGEEIRTICGDALTGAFLDETPIQHPLQYLHAQSSATVEARAATYYRHGPEIGRVHDVAAYGRLLLPSWGDGRISMLLGAFALG
jgi:hypothetical protein